MPIEIKDIDGGLGNIVALTGVVTEQEFADAMAEHMSQDPEKFRRYNYSLTDLTQTTELNFSAVFIRNHAQVCVQMAEINPEAIVVAIAPEDLDFGLSRMWETLCDETDWETGVFRSGAEARDWIRERAEARWGITDLTFR